MIVNFITVLHSTAHKTQFLRKFYCFNFSFKTETLFALKIEQLDVKDKCGVGWNEPWETTWPIGIIWRAGQFGALSLGHLGDALVPAFDHLANAKWEDKRLATIA